MKQIANAVQKITEKMAASRSVRADAFSCGGDAGNSTRPANPVIRNKCNRYVELPAAGNPDFLGDCNPASHSVHRLVGPLAGPLAAPDDAQKPTCPDCCRIEKQW